MLALLSIAIWRGLAQTNGIELILGLIAKSVTQAILARAQDFYDSHVSADLRANGLLKRLWAKQMRNVFIDVSLRCSALKGGQNSMAKLFLATRCDDVHEEKSGKFSLTGLFDRFIVGDLRAPLPTFWLFVQIGCDTEGEHELTVEFREIVGASVLRAVLKHGIVGKSGITGRCHANVNLRLEHVIVPSTGIYEFALSSDGLQIGALPVEVVQAQSRVVR